MKICECGKEFDRTAYDLTDPERPEVKVGDGYLVCQHCGRISRYKDGEKHKISLDDLTEDCYGLEIFTASWVIRHAAMHQREGTVEEENPFKR